MREQIYETTHPGFDTIIHPDAELAQCATGMGFTEGPVWMPKDNSVLFTDIPNNRIMRWSATDGLSIYDDNSHYAIGLYLDLDGRLLACEHTTKRLTRYEDDGTTTVLASWNGEHILNSTNDVVVRASDGDIFFTDPPFGVRFEDGELVGYQVGMEYVGAHVFRVTDDPHAPQIVTGDIYRPKGLCFSPDESTLYVSDSSEKFHQVYRLRMQPDNVAHDPQVFAVIPNGAPNGMRVDTDGRLYVAGPDGVYVYEPNGTLLGKIRVPERVSNLCFGGTNRQTLYITASSSLYAIEVKTTGLQKP